MAWFLYTYILFQVHLNDHDGALVALVYIFLVFLFSTLVKRTAAPVLMP